MKSPIRKTPEPRNESAVDQAARELRNYALTQENGQFLGSEDELILRFGVSRPTLRQASAKVALEHLVTIRRGVGGGYFARTPGSASVSRIAALYLRSRHASFTEITAAIKPLRAELAKLAARNHDPALHEKLSELISHDEAMEAEMKAGGHGYRAFLRSEREFERVLGLMGDNAVLSLLLNILYDFAAHVPREDDVLISRPARVRQYCKLRAKLARAILEGDEEIAEVSSRRCSDLVAEWIHKDFEGRRFDTHDLSDDTD
jgi:GntR family transcriptional repressor for pyruvate dehydrogenase complex